MWVFRIEFERIVFDQSLQLVSVLVLASDGVSLAVVALKRSEEFNFTTPFRAGLWKLDSDFLIG